MAIHVVSNTILSSIWVAFGFLFLLYLTTKTIIMIVNEIRINIPNPPINKVDRSDPLTKFDALLNIIRYKLCVIDK